MSDRMECIRIGNCQKKEIVSCGKTIDTLYLNICNDDAPSDSCLYLYLFPGQGLNDEWRRADMGRIEDVMSRIYTQKTRPNMTVVMPYPYYGGDKVTEAQQMYKYLPDIVNAYEGNAAWDDGNKYKARAIAGLSLGGLCALKCALHWENVGTDRKFFGLGAFSPAGEGTYGRWLNGRCHFRFAKDKGERFLYLSEGEEDHMKVHAEAYRNYFNENNSPVDRFYMIKGGRHDWNAFREAFVDFMLQDVFAYDTTK